MKKYKLNRIWKYVFFFDRSQKKKIIFIRVRKNNFCDVFFRILKTFFENFLRIIDSSNSYATKDIKLADKTSAKYAFAKMVMDFIDTTFLIDEKCGSIPKPHIKTAHFRFVIYAPS